MLVKSHYNSIRPKIIQILHLTFLNPVLPSFPTEMINLLYYLVITCISLLLCLGRRSLHQFDNPEEEASSLIYNYTPVYAGNFTGYEQLYFFWVPLSVCHSVHVQCNALYTVYGPTRHLLYSLWCNITAWPLNKKVDFNSTEKSFLHRHLLFYQLRRIWNTFICCYC